MKAHTKLYLNHFGFDTSSFIPCEVCGDLGLIVTAKDIHHIECRGMGGTKKEESGIFGTEPEKGQRPQAQDQAIRAHLTKKRRSPNAALTFFSKTAPQQIGRAHV